MNTSPHTRIPRAALALIAAGLLAACLPAPAPTAAPTLTAAPGPTAEPAPRPNFLIIIADDMRYDQLDYLPRTREALFEQGVEFTRAYVTTPLCCPSRASVLTGLYAYHHQVTDNDVRLRRRTVVEALHGAGYFTGLVGKYLNSYPLQGRGDPPLPEFDRWVGMQSGGSHARYFDPELQIDGEWQVVEGYQTFILRDYALSFLSEAAERGQPFLLLFDPYAPHVPALPVARDQHLYPEVGAPQTPDFNEPDVSDKPEWLQGFDPLNEEQVSSLAALRRRQAQTLHGLDEAIVELLDALDALAMREDTLVIFLSDNGYLLGEHRIPAAKAAVYEMAAHVPFAVRYPALIDAPRVDAALVANIDIAPTLYALAGVEPFYPLDGQSLVPLLADPAAPWREHLLIEGFGKTGSSPPFAAIHTGRYVYVETPGDRSELYDLAIDPYQLENLIDRPEQAGLIRDLQARLAAYER